MSSKSGSSERIGKRGGRGSHGSTTKAGKVRNQTPKVPKTADHSKNNCPRLRNRKRYYRRQILQRNNNQNRNRTY